MKYFLLPLLFLFSSVTIVVAQSDINTYINTGNEYLRLGNYENAIAEFEKALSIESDNLRASTGKIEALLLLDQSKEAGKLNDKLINQYPSNIKLSILKGRIDINKGKFNNAIDNFNNILNQSPSESELEEIYLYRGAAHQKMLDYDLALDDYKKVIEINKNNIDVYIYRGILYYQDAKYPEAIEDFSFALELDNNHPFAFYNRGMAYLKMSENDKACKDFHKSCELGNLNACKMVVSKCIKL